MRRVADDRALCACGADITRQGCPSRSGAVSARSHWMRHCVQMGIRTGGSDQPAPGVAIAAASGDPPSQRRRRDCGHRPRTPDVAGRSMQLVLDDEDRARRPAAMILVDRGGWTWTHRCRTTWATSGRHLRRSAGAPLLSHSSGLRNPVPIRWVHRRRTRTRCAAVLERLLEAAATAFAPGSRAAYPIVGYLALGAIIGELTGETSRRTPCSRSSWTAGDDTHRVSLDGSDGGERAAVTGYQPAGSRPVTRVARALLAARHLG